MDIVCEGLRYCTLLYFFKWVYKPYRKLAHYALILTILMSERDLLIKLKRQKHLNIDLDHYPWLKASCLTCWARRHCWELNWE